MARKPWIRPAIRPFSTGEHCWSVEVWPSQGHWIPPAVAKAFAPQPVFLARGQRYDGPLADTIRRGLTEVGFDAASVYGRRVLLKPNLVEPSQDAPYVTTHPARLWLPPTSSADGEPRWLSARARPCTG